LGKIILETFDEFNKYAIKARKLFDETSSEYYVHQEIFSSKEKKLEEHKLTLLIDKIFEKENGLNNNEFDYEDIQIIIEDYLKEQRIIKIDSIDETTKKTIFKTTEKFITESRKFDSTLSAEELFQALRNVWIVNILQVVFDRGVELTKSIKGYSLLYPYTDNFIDDNLYSKGKQKKFMKHFELRLQGKRIEPTDVLEQRVFELITDIEKEYLRSEHQLVYDSLLYIYEGQKNSMLIQSKRTLPYEQDVLKVSVEKGGASVLADGYLISGSMSEEQAEFAFLYGVILQLCDDLQDIEEDFENNHMTIFSQCAPIMHLDHLVYKLINFIKTVIYQSAYDFDYNLKDLIVDNCILLIHFAIATNSKYFSKEFIKNVDTHLPVRIKYIKKLEKKIAKNNYYEGYNY